MIEFSTAEKREGTQVVITRNPVARALRSEFLRHGALVFAATSLVNAFNYVFHFILSRRLGVESYGDLSSLLNSLVVISVPATILMLVVVKFAAEFHALDDRAKLRTFSARVLQYSAVAGVAAFAITVGCRGVLSQYLHLASSEAIVPMAAIFAIGIVSPGARGILQGVQDFRQLAVATSIESALKLFAGVSLVVAGFGVTGAMTGFALGNLIGLTYTLIAVRRHWGAAGSKLTLDFRRLAKAMSGIAVATAVIAILSGFDVPLVKHFFSAEEAGFYSAVALAGKVLFFVVGFIPTVILPKATAKATKGESTLGILVQSALLMIAISGCGLALFYAAPKTIVILLAGPAFSKATPYIFEYGLSLTLLAFASVSVTYKIALHRFDFVLPLIAVVLGEIVTINLWHPSIRAVVTTLAVGNFLAFCGTLYKIHAPARVYERVAQPNAA